MKAQDKMESLAKRSRWASLIGLALVVGMLIYSSYMLYSQQRLLEMKRAQIKDLNTVIEKTKQQIEQKRKDLAECVIQLDDINKKLEASRYLLAKQAASEAAAAMPDTSLTGATVYIHIQDSEQQEIAMAVGARLQAAGFSIPADPILVKEGTKSNQVRYFHPEDLHKAKEIVMLLDSMGVPAIMNDLSAEKNYSQSMAASYYELWLGRQTAFVSR